MVKVENGLVEECTSQGFEERKYRCRPRAKWLDGLKKACSAGLLDVSNKKVTLMNRESWRGYANGTSSCVDA